MLHRQKRKCHGTCVVSRLRYSAAPFQVGSVWHHQFPQMDVSLGMVLRQSTASVPALDRTMEVCPVYSDHDRPVHAVASGSSWCILSQARIYSKILTCLHVSVTLLCVFFSFERLSCNNREWSWTVGPLAHTSLMLELQAHAVTRPWFCSTFHVLYLHKASLFFIPNVYMPTS